MISFSQIGQDLEVLKLYKYKKNGFFVEIGASDGITFSNTYLLEQKYQWKGICVEPLPYKINLLKKNRPNSDIVNKAVFDKTGLNLDFKISNTDDLLSGISKYISTHKSTVNKNCTVIKVKTITLNDLLKENNAPLFIDYLSVDTEGTELEILMSVDLKKYTFGLIHVEHNYVEPTRSSIKNYLLKNNYTFYGENQFDDSYIHNSLLERDDIYIREKTKQPFTIVYKTCQSQLKWLYYSLVSLQKYLDPTNIFEIIIYVHDIVYTDVIRLLDKIYMNNFIKCRLIPIAYNYHGYLKEMVYRANCYKEVKTEYLIFLNSETLLQKSLSFNSLITKDRKIKWNYLKIEDDPTNKAFTSWKKAMEDSTLQPKTEDYKSNGFPFILTRQSLEDASNYFYTLHNSDYDIYCQKKCDNKQICVETPIADIYNDLYNIFSDIDFIGYYCRHYSNDYIFRPIHINKEKKSYFIQNFYHGEMDSKYIKQINDVFNHINTIMDV